MASKHSGHILHLHLDKIIELFLDDLLIECVHDLQVIEDLQLKQDQQENLKKFIKNYYSNFEMIRNMETDISKKLMSKNYLNVEQVKIARENEEFRKNENSIKIYKNPFEEVKMNQPNANHLISNEIYKNYYANGKYKTNLHKNLIFKTESYSKEYHEYMKVTGAFYLPNIFTLYDELVKEIISEILEEELDVSVKHIDNFVTEMYKSELLNLNN
jgi:hypothetical protein